MITLALLAAITITDGDSIRIGAERIRLAGVDAPELGPCPRHRICTPGDGHASKRALQRLLDQGEPVIVRVGRDRYGRTLAKVYVRGRNVACELIAGGYAVARYEARWTRECGR
jgi:micrococcal nuclease